MSWNADTLPAPVQRYVAFALETGAPAISRARLHQRGVMRSGIGERWLRFTAREQVDCNPIGLSWEAWVQAAPLATVRVRDSYAAGVGASEARLFGMFWVGGRRGTPEMAAASLVRYLAESPWFPTSLLPSDRLAWSAIDDERARATLTDGAMSVSAEFQFGPGGEIAGVSAQRHRDVGGAMVLTPWAGQFTAYTSIGRMRIPMAAVVGWMPDGAFIPVWRGEVLDAEYSFA